MGNITSCTTYNRCILQYPHLYSEYLYSLVQNNSVKRWQGSAFTASVIQRVYTEQLSSACMRKEGRGLHTHTGGGTDDDDACPAQTSFSATCFPQDTVIVNTNETPRANQETKWTTNSQCFLCSSNEHINQFVHDFHLHPTKLVTYAKQTESNRIIMT